MLVITAFLFGALISLGGMPQAGQTAAQSPFVETIYSSYIEPFGGSLPGTTLVTERIYYHRRVVNNFQISDGLPSYLSRYSCGITAGGVAVSYFNRSFPELIPNHTAGRYLLGRWLWGAQGAGVNSMFSSLFSMMGATSQGVTMDGYLNGMRTYAASRGRTATFTSVRSGNNRLNAAQYQAAFRQGRLLSVFMSGFGVTPLHYFHTGNGYDVVRSYVDTTSHIMIAFGYRHVYYYNAANQRTRSDVYLYVHTGFSSPITALLPLYRFGNVDNAFITHIF